MERLLDDFPVPDLEVWRDEVVRLLKGTSFEKKMLTRTLDGLTLKPIYTAADTAELNEHLVPPGYFPYLRGTEAPQETAVHWEVAQELTGTDPAELNRQLRHDLQRGQTAANLVLESAVTADQLDTALAGVDLTQVPLYLDTGTGGPDFELLLTDLCRRRGTDPGQLRGAVGSDPLAQLARHGALPVSLEQARDHQARLCRWASATAPGLRTIMVRGDVWHEAGAGAAQELACAMAAAVETLRRLEERELGVDQAVGRFRFIFSVDTDFFGGIAKFRAARLLWARIVGACGGRGPSAKLYFHARSSGWSQTCFDPHTNILRATTQAFAAIAGGCQSLHLAPFDQCRGLPGELSRRLARNTQLVLRDESNFHRVADPAGGSWYVETLTRQQADRAWELFQELECAGGMTEALRRGIPQQMAARTAALRRQRLADRRDVLVGTNRYPLAGEAPAEHPVPEIGAAVPGGEVETVPTLRGGAPFEALRTRVTIGGPQRVLLAAMGPPAGYMARLEFVRSFYQVGGFEVLGDRHFETADEVTAAVAEQQPAAVCIVSRDEQYAELVPVLVRTLRKANPDLVLHLAGGTEADKQAGVGQRITLRSDVLQVLEELAGQTGVAS